MSDAKIINEKNRTEMKNGAAERAEAVRAEADRIASQILTLTRNGLFVSLRFLDLALCQFEYINSEKIRGNIKWQNLAYLFRYSQVQTANTTAQRHLNVQVQKWMSKYSKT